MSVRCERFFHDHAPEECCPDPAHHAALTRRRGGAPAWSEIRDGDAADDWRQYLNGEPIHCGDGLELQAREVHGDDYGEYPVLQPTGVVVRYEVALVGGRRLPMLHATVAGIEFTRVLEPSWMRFRWPPRRPERLR